MNIFKLAYWMFENKKKVRVFYHIILLLSLVLTAYALILDKEQFFLDIDYFVGVFVANLLAFGVIQYALREDD